MRREQTSKNVPYQHFHFFFVGGGEKLASQVTFRSSNLESNLMVAFSFANYVQNLLSYLQQCKTAVKL